MRVNPVTTARAAWYDRNPVAKCSVYNVFGVTPHIDTQRWTYTVPAGKKFNLQTAQANIQRESVAGALSTAYARIRYTISGASALGMLMALNENNAVGAQQIAAIGSAAVLLAGDAIEGTTIDASTGGTQGYFLAMSGLEFDA